MTQPTPEGDDKSVRDEVLRLLERSDALQVAVRAALTPANAPSTRKGLLATSIGAVSLEHWGAQRLLLREGLFVTGFALVRLQFEAVVRAIWILECAKNDWLERFVAPMPDEQLEEPVLGPPVPAMLSAIAKRVPEIAGMLSQLKEGTWQAMHSYVHGGVRPIVHSLAGTTHYQVSGVIKNANGLGLLAVNAMVIALQDSRLVGLVAHLQREYGDCMPPSKPVIP